MKKVYAKSGSESGITADDFVLHRLQENEKLTIKTITVFLLDTSELSNVEFWCGNRYDGSQSVLFVKAYNNMTGQRVTINPNVTFEAGEQFTVSVALGDAGAVCDYTVIYEIETLPYSWAVPASQDIAPCSLYSKMLGRC